MIALPSFYLSEATQKIAKKTLELESMHIDNNRIGILAGDVDGYWVYLWFVESDLDDLSACNEEFQKKLQTYIETVKDF
jgi:hypothetical protein